MLIMASIASGYIANIIDAAAPARIGQARAFMLDTERHGERPLIAKLGATGQHTDIWVDSSQSVPQDTLSRLLAGFDERIYPNNIEYFASTGAKKQAERVSILVTDLDGIDGYFDSGDITGGNRLNLIYLDAGVAKNEPDEALNTLAHEFAHLLFYLSGGANIEWLDEGLAVYAEYINGGDPSLYLESFLNNPDVKLTGEFSNKNSSYGAAFLFIAFAAEQVEKSGCRVPGFTRSLIESSGGGMRGIDATLRDYINDPRFDSFGEIYQSTNQTKKG